MEMTLEAIEERWETGYRVYRGRVSVDDQPDPRQDVRALLSMVRRLRPEPEATCATQKDLRRGDPQGDPEDEWIAPEDGG